MIKNFHIWKKEGSKRRIIMEEQLKKFAKVLLVNGVNIQKGQILYLNCSVEAYQFGRMVEEEAYLLGAKKVELNYNDTISQKTMFHYASKETLSDFEDWRKEKFNYLGSKDVAMLSIIYPNFEDYTEEEIENMQLYQKIAFKNSQSIIDKQMNYEMQWSLTYYPNVEWAKKVFPNLNDNEALNELWKTVYKMCRIDQEDSITAWQQHDSKTKEKAAILNSYQFKELHYENSLGTNVTIGLPKKHTWIGVSKKTSKGVVFIPNIPTEELFTTPDKTKTNGIVYASLPLVYQGSTIEDIVVEFKEGKAVKFSASKGQKMLEEIITADEGSAYLGEVALVNISSPISNSGLLFYSTLYDENASCHVAFGNAYSCFEDANQIDEEEMKRRGKNTSRMHVDFMIGTNDLRIKGITANNQEVDVFIDGEWAI